ncbi:MAG: hypothetical protein FJX62_07855 [Alphaproteobacteria bacterium]|nr:hypothetical protein [Alphaproteobacteria bacterium]
MKKIALMAALAALVAIPAEAATKKKAKAAKKAATAQVSPNDAGRRLVMDSLPSLYPAPIKFVMYHGQKQAAAKPAKKAKKKK